MQQMRTLFTSLRNSQPQNNNDAAANAGGNQPGGQNGNGPGNRGGRGGFDREAMRKAMEQPEVKAQMESMREKEAALRPILRQGVQGPRSSPVVDLQEDAR